MTIKIDDGPEITITRAKYERFKEEYLRLCLWHAPWRPDSLDDYILEQMAIDASAKP